MGAGKRFSACVQAGDDPAGVSLAASIAVEEFVNDEALGERTSARLSVVVEELVSNAARHGLGHGPVAIALTLAAGQGCIAIVMEDDGIPFDPTHQREFAGPDTMTGGGVGLALVRAWSKSLRYTRESGRNRIALTLSLA